MKDKVICEKYNNCPLEKSVNDCYHLTPHYHIDNCIPSKSETIISKCGCCKSMKDIRKLKLDKISEQSSGFTKSKINENK